MDKYGVEDVGDDKTASEDGKCPICGADLEEDAGVRKCPVHGTAPFEQPDEEKHS